MTDYATMTDEQLAKMRAAGGDGKGWKGSLKTFIDPAGRKQADAATAELERRRKQAEQDAKDAAEIDAAKKKVSEIKFKSGGMVRGRGDGAAQRGKTRGKIC